MKSNNLSSLIIADFLGLKHIGPEIVPILGVTTLDEPMSGHLAFCISKDNPRIRNWGAASGVIIGPEGLSVGRESALLVSDNPRRDFGKALYQFFEKREISSIAQTAVIHPNVEIGEGVSIGHNSVIERDVTIGNHTIIGNNSTILARTQIGNNCVVGSNTVIGSLGFGFEQDDSGEWVRLPHIGNVVIEDKVEIGSLTVVARGTIHSTRIEQNAKIDDNVFIAHNVQIGKNCVVIANSEISGSVRVGHDSWISPGVTIIEGVSIGNNSMVGIGSVVIRDVPSNVVVVGNPARFLRDR